MPDMQLVHSSPKEDKNPLPDDPVESQALVPVENIIKTVTDFQTQYEISTSESGKDSVLKYPTKRRSCALVNIPSPCVNKAIHHIEQLKVKMKKWFQQHKYAAEKTKVVRFADISRESQDEVDLLVPTSLEITGVEVIKPEAGDAGAMKQDTEEVVTEVIELIWRLEADRQAAEEALKLQRLIKKSLVTKIDSLSLWRLQQLPAAVENGIKVNIAAAFFMTFSCMKEQIIICNRLASHFLQGQAGWQSSHMGDII
ncbi:coiled-coil domain-containing protein 178-like [Rhinatrema bivittatum]|uniref:coiled-coil domain-containing protein 178-like n=1 Tax=Rhinatrema bivittatum TaxID=194408 RepID=UPI00112E29DA|nr:coiled-coil domain-containing protein 178-like [Rhinatrema bivittatum]